MNLPTDFQSFLNLIASQVFIGLLLTWLIEHVPFIQDDKVKDWLKLLFAVGVCTVWALGSTLILQGELPHTGQGWYALILLIVAVLFTNQASYKLIDHIPALRDFFLTIFGKGATAIITSSTSTTATAGQSLQLTLDAGPGTATAPVAQPGG